MTMGDETVREAYAFVCLQCGHGWEEAYEIRHSTDLQGREHATYYVAGRHVASPFAGTATCPSCEGRRIRILRPGRVESTRRP